MLTSAKDSGRCQTPSGLHPLGVILSSRCHKWCQHPEERKRKPSVSPYLSGVTFAEWEYACRAGTVTAYSFGSDRQWLGEYAVFNEQKAHPVAKKRPNLRGLFDMHGNAQEWCHDYWGDYGPSSDRDPTGPPYQDPVDPTILRDARVIRGGAYTSSAKNCRSARRNSNYISTDWTLTGFRLCMSVPHDIVPPDQSPKGASDGQ